MNEHKPTRYGCWAGNPKGTAEDTERCIERVWPRFNGMVSSQCSRKRGHGRGGLYCKQHAKRNERD